VIGGVVLQTTTERAVEIGTQLLGLAVLAGALAAVAALGYRWAARERVSTALTLLVGLSGVALYLNTTTALGQAIGGDMVAAETGVALFNIGAFLAGGVGATAGTRAGDRFATDVLLDAGTSDVDEEVNRLVRTVGRVVTVTLPGEVDDVVGYDPVTAATKEKLAGKRFVFPQNLTVAELQRRLVSRLKTDYGVGTVDVDLTADGEVAYLAVGARAAGIGPTLPPATNAVAIRADPAFSASAGDVVQVWEIDPMRRVLTAELRGVAGDVATIAIDAADTPKLDPRQRYRLVTLPVEDRPEREFAALLREADETYSTVTVAPGSPLDGMPVGALDLAVVAVRPGDEQAPPVALPDDDQVLAPADVVFAIALPEALRRLEAAGEALDPSLGSADRPQIGEADEDAAPAGAVDDQPTAGEPTSEDPDPAVEATGETAPANADEPEDTPEITGKVDDDTFDELKSTFESGDAGWADEDGESDNGGIDGDPPTDSAGSEGGDEGTGGGGGTDDLVDLDDAEISFDESADESEADLFDLEEDDGESLDLDLPAEDDDDGDEEGAGDDDGDGGAEDDDDDDDEGGAEADDDDGGNGGGKSFAQLKEEFDSGDADWEDDVSDSPGGDMRLDE